MDELRTSGNAHDMETHDKIVLRTIANFSLQLLEYARFVPSMTIGKAQQIDYLL